MDQALAITTKEWIKAKYTALGFSKAKLFVMDTTILQDIDSQTMIILSTSPLQENKKIEAKHIIDRIKTMMITMVSYENRRRYMLILLAQDTTNMFNTLTVQLNKNAELLELDYQIYTEQDAKFDPTTHYFTGKWKLIQQPKDKTLTLEARDRMRRIRYDDAIVRWYNWKPGQIINNLTNGKSTMYLISSQTYIAPLSEIEPVIPVQGRCLTCADVLITSDKECCNLSNLNIQMSKNAF